MLLRAALLSVLLFVPLCAAEDAHVQALGASMGLSQGVAGFQWDDDSAVGVRYWHNQTSEGDDVELVVTACATPDSEAVVYCERFHLSP